MRLGDDIDDHCSRCKRTTDHAVVSLDGEEAGKVRCRTCHSEHTYRHNRSGRAEMTAKQAFDTVLASVTANQPQGDADGKDGKKKRVKKPN